MGIVSFCEFWNLISQAPILDRGTHSIFIVYSILPPPQPLMHCQLFDLAKDYPEPPDPTFLPSAFSPSQIYLTSTFSVIRLIGKRKIGALGNGIKVVLPRLITFCLLKGKQTKPMNTKERTNRCQRMHIRWEPIQSSLLVSTSAIRFILTGRQRAGQ